MFYKTNSGYFLNISKINLIKHEKDDVYYILFSGGKSFSIKLEQRELKDIVFTTR